MKYLDIMRMICRNLVKRKTRTLLTVSGVVIGTCAIIVMLSLGIGMSAAQATIVGQWADLTMITVYNQPIQRTNTQTNGNMTITTSQTADGAIEPIPLDMEMVKKFREIKHVKAVSPFERVSINLGDNFAYHSGDYTLMWQDVTGVDMSSLDMFGYKIQDGRWKNETDSAFAVIIGYEVGSYAMDMMSGDRVFGERDPDDYSIVKSYGVDLMDTKKFPDSWKFTPITSQDSNGNWISNDVDKFSVITSPKSPNLEFSIEAPVIGRLKSSQDWQANGSILIDVNSLPKLADAYNTLYSDNKISVDFKKGFNTVRVRVDDMNNVEEVQKYIQETYNYQTSSNTDSLDSMRASTNMIQAILGALAAISLFVAALNITNTMIMAVIERTKEIGVMKVLGCDLSKIRLIFLGEAAMIGVIGGVVGVILSYIISFVFNKFLGTQFMSSMNGGANYSVLDGVNISVITPVLILLGIGFATIVGVAAGFGPANRSVKISALAAITNE